MRVTYFLLPSGNFMFLPTAKLFSGLNWDSATIILKNLISLFVFFSRLCICVHFSMLDANFKSILDGIWYIWMWRMSFGSVCGLCFLSKCLSRFGKDPPYVKLAISFMHYILCTNQGVCGVQ